VLGEAERRPTVFERRAERLALPACPTCSAHATHVATRTEWFLYLRCPPCGNVWSVPKPRVNPVGS